ncbi:glycoside hydrolase family 3 N-terminal domain-containing protein [Parabacteroides sp. ZJ-118]|uniref:glycoside hydrolase family 3 C-terminal domain-containing protein n=1 Tax=Parabacteroides sp. ZJ-118 TaxID=2709398 RepID=UPI0013EB83AC|nr:glycoside hydrolase family 3 N-terminal domain-containing protein [Parabacteroides sp. ZJ-118]
MNKLFMLACLTMALRAGQAQTLPRLGEDPVEKVVAAMTTEEKVSLLIGTGMPGFGGQSAVVGSTQDIVPGAAGTTFPIERLGIPAIVVADGPAGLRISPTREGDEATYYCTAFPVATLLASTWNTALVESVGKAMGDEVKAYGCDVLLAPALNIHRSPLCGRNFEYYSEDPYLTGRIAAAMVNGIQSNGVGTSIKHFAVNNQETNRTGTDARLSARALREIYLRGFERVVKEASPWTVMSSYNKINGEYTSESRDLLTTILRDEWGFDGLVMTDWFGGKEAPAQIRAGNDLLMPGRPDQKAALLKALETGSLAIEEVDRDVTRVLRLILRSPRFARYAYSNQPDLKAHAEVTRASASEGMVLLKNTDNTLPLAPGIRKIAAYGTTSYDFIAGGTGSGDVNEAYTVSLVEGLERAGYVMDAEVKALYESYGAEEKARQPKDANPAAAFFNHPRIPEFVPDAAGLAAKAREADIAFVTIGRSSGEFQDRKVEGDFNLTANERALIQSVCDAFHREGKKVVVILNIGGVIETASWKSAPDAILLAWQAGQEGGNTVADILSGKVNPSGKLPMTFPASIADVPSTKNFPDASSLDPKEMLAGFMGGSPERTDRRNIDYTCYEEGIYVGYRYFDTFGVPVSYPFGYGLSYTTFDYSGLRILAGDAGYRISCTVTNNGPVAGKEVAQLYVSAPGESMDKPAKELRGFAKTRLLQPGESDEILFEVRDSDLASFDERASHWVVEPGSYEARVGSSAADIRLRGSFRVKGRVTEKTHAVLLPVAYESSSPFSSRKAR